MDLERAGSLQMHVDACRMSPEGISLHVLRYNGFFLMQKVDFERAGSLRLHIGLCADAYHQPRSR